MRSDLIFALDKVISNPYVLKYHLPFWSFTMYFEQTHFRYVAIFSIVIILLISVSKPDLWSVVQSTQAQVSADKVFVMYAASLIKTFEDTLGPAFQNKLGIIMRGRLEAQYKLQI